VQLSHQLYEGFEIEITKSEYKRVRLMIGTFALGLVIIISNYFFLDQRITAFYGGVENYFFVAFWILLLIGYEVVVLGFIKHAQKTGRRISNRFKYTSSLIEISFPSLLIFYMVDVEDMLIFIDSPIMLMYFLFIIFSTLHLDLKLSVITGILAAVEFTGIVYYGYHHKMIAPEVVLNLPENSFYVRAVVFVIAGGAAGFVADEVKKRVKSSFESQRAKNEMEVLFGQQVSREVLKALVEDRDTIKKTEATVMALDIRNFSGFAEKRSPDEIMEFQNKIFGPILMIINQHQGVVNQILGDGIMATFGSPVENILHADMAFLAGLKIVDKVKELCEQGIIPETKVGIGLHLGKVITGNIGNEQRKQYSISGTAVIIAFRVEQLNKEFESEFLITEEVKNRIEPGKVPIMFIGSTSLKGLDSMVNIYRVK
jgi:adenylate cyclase